ncbi:von Willebrand factor type A [[Leptolyngbya] sp. PCC 7376]|uniref:vWA domain-containing protein n=1 Tax=[Leptolyngbya] sp. PCC 7376 TaxID=111781 RepID=UPI00029F24BA|nr:VWA domain-containing protein [[Leptolyngbya] sp. PCC 7376]AFY38049.1 von Willebrand factor type A [[Leptolyngbya] sp. PCC 7376]
MKVGLQVLLSDAHLDAQQSHSQRQLSFSISAIADELSQQQGLPLNLCLVLDHSGSMAGKPLRTVKEAAIQLVDRLDAGDRLSVIAFDHKAKVIVNNQTVADKEQIKKKISRLEAAGGTSIDDGMRLGLDELAAVSGNYASQVFMLTDGENEHGDNDRCLKIARLAAEFGVTLNALGFGVNWNQDVLESIADAANGSLAYIETPEQASETFNRLLSRAQSVGLTNAQLLLQLTTYSRLADLKPLAQVAPETIELEVIREGDFYGARLGDLLTDVPRVILANVYIDQLAAGDHIIATAQVRYDDPASGQTQLLSESIPVSVEVQANYQPDVDSTVQMSILALAKYRQTQMAEAKLKSGDRQGAATMLQTAAKTAIQLGDDNAATVLQKNATQLQSGNELSKGDRKRTRMVSKTIIQPPSNSN